MGECSQWGVDNDFSVIEKLLEFGGGGGAVLLGEISQAANVCGISCVGSGRRPPSS
jgi:hypothetical protein